MSTFRAVDLFCGAGGTSTGLAHAAEAMGRRLRLLAINHWRIAVETHAANHPDAEHMCASIETIDPEKVVPGRRLNLLVASPECTHHSTARGGRPMNDQSRASAWHVLHWATALDIGSILVENVPEFTTWGPLGTNGRPLASRKGETFSAWVAALRSLNYRVEWRVLNCADYGDPTTRERLFVVACKGRRPIEWPEPTHAPRGEATLFGSRSPWRAAREIIDWNLRGASIFTRARPLAPRTLERIAEGLRRFGGKAAEPFLVPYRSERPGQAPRTHSLLEPMPTVTAGANGFGLAEPFLIGQQSGSIPRPVSEPAPTISTKGAVSLVEPFLVSYYGNGSASSAREPVPTVTTKDRFGLVEPAQLDILFRMLQPHELAAAMSFPRGYHFAGNKTEIVKQVGNAVPVETAAALCRSLIGRAA